MGLSLRKLGGKIFDQLNPFDNGKTYQNSAGNGQTSSVAHQIGQFGTAIARPPSQFVNTVKAGTGGVYGLGKLGISSLFGTDQGYQNTLTGVNKSLNQDLNPNSGILGQGTYFKNRAEAQNLTPRALAGKSIAQGAQLAPFVLPETKFLSNPVVNRLATNAVIGGTGSAAGQYAETGKINPKTVATSAATAAALGEVIPVAKAIAKGSKPVLASEVGAVGKDVSPALPNVSPTTSPTPVRPTVKAVGKGSVLNNITDEYLGKKTAGSTRNTAIVSQLPKLDTPKSFGLIDAIQQGADNGNFSGVGGTIRQVLDNKFNELRQAGVDIGYLRDYFPQQWKNGSPEDVTDAYMRLNQRAGIQTPRTIPTVQEGMSLGFTPKHTDYRAALQDYLDTADRLIANKQYFDQLQGQGLITASAKRPNGMQVIDAPGLPQARSVTDPELGVEVQQNYYAKPEVAKELNKLFSPDIRGTGGKVAAVTGKTSSAMQTLFLSGGIPGTPLNAFGAAQWGKQTLAGHPISATKQFFRAFSEKAARNYETANIDSINKMQGAGVPYGGTLDSKALTTVGERIAEQHGLGKGKAAIIEGWNKAVEDPTFRRYMPLMQLDTFKGAYDRLIKRGASEADAVSQAAELTRHAFGLNTLAKDAFKSKVGKDVTRTVFFAPKFRESMVNFWGDNVKALGHPNSPAYRDNVKFLANATILFGLMQAANMALNEGKTTFQNDNPNDRLNLNIPTGEGKSVSVPFLSSIATVPRTAINAGVDIAGGNFKDAGLEGKKLLSQLVRPGVDVAFNQKYNGREIYNENDPASKKLKDVGGYVAGQYNHPYVQAAYNAASGKSSGTLETAATATELPIRFRNYDQTTPQAKDIKSTQDLASFKKTVKSEGYDLQQLSNGKYAYSINGDVHTSDSLKSAREAIAKDTFTNSDASSKVIGNKYWYKDENGDTKSMPKYRHEFDVEDSQNQLDMYVAKENGDYGAWSTSASKQLKALETLRDKYNKDSQADKVDDVQKKIETLKHSMKTYASYGGNFTKGGRSGGGGNRTAGSAYKYAVTAKSGGAPKPSVNIKQTPLRSAKTVATGKPKVSIKKSAV